MRKRDMSVIKTVRQYIHDRPKLKKTIGVILVIVGLAALITPLTPGSWLIVVGLELLGLRFLLSGKWKFWIKK